MCTIGCSIFRRADKCIKISKYQYRRQKDEIIQYKNSKNPNHFELQIRLIFPLINHFYVEWSKLNFATP